MTLNKPDTYNVTTDLYKGVVRFTEDESLRKELDANILRLSILRNDGILEARLRTRRASTDVGPVPAPERPVDGPRILPIVEIGIVEGRIYASAEVGGRIVQFDLGMVSELSDPKQLTQLAESLVQQLRSTFDPQGTWSNDVVARLLTSVTEKLSGLPTPLANDPSLFTLNGPVRLTT